MRGEDERRAYSLIDEEGRSSCSLLAIRCPWRGLGAVWARRARWGWLERPCPHVPACHRHARRGTRTRFRRLIWGAGHALGAITSPDLRRGSADAPYRTVAPGLLHLVRAT